MENGDVYCALELSYDLKGRKLYDIFLKVYKHMPKIEATVRIHKISRWKKEKGFTIPSAAARQKMRESLPDMQNRGGENHGDLYYAGCRRNRN